MKKKLIFILLAFGVLFFIICTQKKTNILPKSELSIPPGYSEKKWEGVLKECERPEELPEHPGPGGCGSCYNYTLEQKEQKEYLTFNDRSYENLDKYIDKQVILIGYITEEPVLIKCPNRNIVTKIEIEPEVRQFIEIFRSKLIF